MKIVRESASAELSMERLYAVEAPKYWWVNHKQTHQQEIDGAYLWSPKKKKNEAKNLFYDNMRRACPGDLILSYAGGYVSYVGRVKDYASVANKPREFGRAGDVWANEGWLLPVDWISLPNPVAPKTILGEISTYLPVKYSPLHPQTGNGNQHAYLAEIDANLFEIIEIKSGVNISAHMRASGDYPSPYSPLVEQVEDEIESNLISDTSLSRSEKEQLIKARRGQGRFRLNLFAVEDGCRLTNITRRDLLLASHIKPWRCCTNSAERLDGNNGLLLTPTADLLFDRGLISFRDDGEILKSPQLKMDEILGLGLTDVLEKNVGTFSAKQSTYLEYHRKNIFLAEVRSGNSSRPQSG